VWQTLASPAGAGVHAEIGLENTLRSFGLESGRDYVTQFSVNYDDFENSGRLRPDVVIFLPDDNLVVIDAKSSKFFLELADLAKDASDADLNEKLRKTMNQHLKDLQSKDYKTAVKNSAKCEPKIVFSVIYLPSEAARERVLRADPEFRQKCFKQGLILADPSSIPFILNVATHEISRVRQESNHKMIMKEVGKLISSMDIFVRYIEDVGGSIKKAADNYSKLSKSVNGRLLSRVRNMLDYGVEPEKGVKMPQRLRDFTVIENSSPLIDDADDVTEIAALEKENA
jgi:DNA recombination protein RmuC